MHQLILIDDINRLELLNAIEEMVLPKNNEFENSVGLLVNIKDKPIILVVEDNSDNVLTANALLASNYTIIKAFTPICNF
jgi:hypothetical protein